MTDLMSGCKHEYVDRIVHTKPAWSTFTKIVIYCKNCGRISEDRHI